jgi:outer membrane protein assembly factor BamB
VFISKDLNIVIIEIYCMSKITFAFKNMVGQKSGRIAEKWKYDSGSLLLSSPVVADIDNDGQKEIIFGTKNGVLMSIDIEGKPKWTYTVQDNLSDAELMFLDTETRHSINASPNIEDINMDGQKEVVFGTEGGKLYVLDSKGKLIWDFQAEGPIRGTPFIQKFSNKDSGIIFGSNDKNLYFLNSKGKLYWKYYAESEIESCPLITIGKQPLVVFGTNDGTIHALNLKGEPVWKYRTKAKIIAQPVFEKLTKSDAPLIILGSTDGSVYCLTEGGELVWEFKTGGAICSRVVVADIDQDGRNEILFGSCDNCIYSLDSNGKKLWSYETDFWVVTSPIVIDIDQDGKLEIIVGSYDHNIYVLDSQGSYVLDYVPGVSGIVGQTGTYGDAVTKEPGKTQGKKIWQYQTDGIIVGCAVVPDFKNIIVNIDSGKVNNLIHTKE